MKGNDNLAVRDAIPTEHCLRIVETLAEVRIRSVLSRRIQRFTAFYSGLSEKYRNDPVAISEAIAADLTLPVSVLSFLTVALRRYFENLTVL